MSEATYKVINCIAFAYIIVVELLYLVLSISLLYDFVPPFKCNLMEVTLYILAVALDVQHRQEQGSRTEVVAPLDGISLLALIVLDNLRDP